MIEIGVVAGLVIGLTGIGSGSLLTPLLILAGGMSPATAVGTSLVFSGSAKLFGSWSFYRRGLVRMDIARDLSLGALPGALAGAFVVRYLGLRHPETLNVFLLRTIGVVLILVSVLTVVRMLPVALRLAAIDRPIPLSNGGRRGITVLMGFCVGATVALTSIGSGAALIPAMVLVYRVDAGTLVGTTVFVGTVMAAIAALPHVGLGNVDWEAAGALLLGSIPALWLASQIHGRVLRQIPEGILAAALMALGVRIAFF